MYCPYCGVGLAETEKICPLCKKELPDIFGKGKGMFPQSPRPRDKEDFRGFLFLCTLLFLAAAGICLAMDLAIWKRVTFSGICIGSFLLFYSAFLLPRWFKRPNPVIFFPVFSVCLLCFLLYLDLMYGDGWFLSFAFPVVGGYALLTEAAVVLVRYVRGGRFFIFGALFFLFGAFSAISELLFRITFSLPLTLVISYIPMIFLCALGLGLIVVALVPPFRRYLERRFFV